MWADLSAWPSQAPTTRPAALLKYGPVYNTTHRVCRTTLHKMRQQANSQSDLIHVIVCSTADTAKQHQQYCQQRLLSGDFPHLNSIGWFDRLLHIVARISMVCDVGRPLSVTVSGADHASCGAAQIWSCLQHNTPSVPYNPIQNASTSEQPAKPYTRDCLQHSQHG